MARDRTLDQEKIAFRIDAHNLKVLHGAANVAHVARHLFALEDSAGRLVLTNRSRSTMRQRVAVRGILHREMVPFDDAGESFTVCCSDNIDILTL